MYRVKNSLNAHEFIQIGEINTKPSLTVPDQTLSMKQILDRFAQGLGVGGMKVPVFDEENDLPDPRKLDLSEMQEYAQKYAEEINEIRTKAEEKRAKNAALLAEEREEYERIRKEFREKKRRDASEENSTTST